jgi:hypothetical protein
VPRDGLQREQRAGDIDVEDSAGSPRVDLDDRCGGEDRRIVDQDVDLAERRDGLATAASMLA